MRKKKTVLVGLNKKHRVVWNDPYNRTCIVLANLGFSTKTIAEHTGLTPRQVIYRCGKKHLKLRDYRNGTSAKATALLDKYSLTHKRAKTG